MTTDIKLANEEQITDKPPDPELLAQKGWKKQQESDDSTNNYPDFFQKSFKVQNSKIITTKTAANTYSDANSDANLDANSLSSSKIIQKSVSSTLLQTSVRSPGQMFLMLQPEWVWIGELAQAFFAQELAMADLAFQKMLMRSLRPQRNMVTIFLC